MKNMLIPFLASLALVGIVVAFQNMSSGNYTAAPAPTGDIIFIDDARFVEKCSKLIPNYTINLSCPGDETDLPLFLKEAENVAQAHAYKSMVYSCGDYSTELAGRLQRDGYEAYYCQGRYTPTGTEHAWVKVVIYVEATTGKAIDPRYYAEYEERFCQK